MWQDKCLGFDMINPAVFSKFAFFKTYTSVKPKIFTIKSNLNILVLTRQIVLVFLPALFLLTFVPNAFGHAIGLVSIEGEVERNTLIASFKFPDKIFTVEPKDVLIFFEANFRVYNNNVLCSSKIENFTPPSDNATFVFKCPANIENLKIKSDLSKNLGYTYSLSIIRDDQIKNYTFDIDQSEFSASFTAGSRLRELALKFYDFIKLGMLHIYTGYDHIAFLLAVIMVLSNFGRIIKAVTAFTVAHSTTLILSAIGGISLTSRIVEPIIALSIAYVAFENIFGRNNSSVFQRRWLVAFGFGLVHGLGFAGALKEINIPKNELLVDLVSFNIGIELGQLTIIAVVLPVLYFLNRFSWKSRLVTVLSIVIGGAGVFWFLQRIGLLNIFSEISFNTLLQTLSLLLIFLVFILFQTGVFTRFAKAPASTSRRRGELARRGKFKSSLLNVTRKLLILIIATFVTIAFVPGIFNLKPKVAHAAVPSGVIIAWPSTNTSIPSGWSRVTALDSRFPKMIATSGTNPGATGGSASHNHPYGSHSDHSVVSHSHTYGNSGSEVSGTYADTAGSGSFNHTHTQTGNASSYSIGSGGPVNYDSASVEPPFLSVIFIKSDGTPTGIPNSAVAYYNGSAPSGWTAYAIGANRFLKGAATGGDGGGTGGTADSHSHTSAGHAHSISHTHTVTLNTDTATGGGVTGSGPNQGSTPHTHTATTASFSDGASGSSSESTANGDGTPPWQKLLPVQNTSGANAFTQNIIAMWDGTIASIPSGWALCNGTNCTVNLSQDKFVRGAANSGENGNTGGATTHTHGGGSHSHSNPTGSHTHGSVASGFSGGGATIINDASTTIGSHNHLTNDSGAATANSLGSRSTTASANSSNDPTYTTIAYIQLQVVNQSPNVPTIKGSSPIPGSKPNKDATTITLQGTATDPDASDTVQIDWDYSSNSGGAWTNIGTTSLGTQGTTLSKTWTVSGLTPASTYRLRARTLDNSGSVSSYTTQSADWILTSGCSPPVSGDITISSSCAFPETIDGVDAGNITINNGITLTINSGQTVAFNAAKTITVNGSMAVNTTGQMSQTYLWMVDLDSDGWPATAVQTAQDSSPGGTYRRKALLESDRIIDCNDAASSSTNSC